MDKISIVIPTLNEVTFLAETIAHARRQAVNTRHLEIIVIDSGSTDNTVQTARLLADKLQLHPELKGNKSAILNVGAASATGRILLFLDADTLLPYGYDQAVRKTIRSGYCGGAFEFKLDAPGLIYRLIEITNRIRYRIRKRYYGDQAVFCSREAFEKTNGYPGKPILESAYFCGNLRKIGRLKLVKQPAVTSARRFKEHPSGPVHMFGTDLQIYLKDLLGLDVSGQAKTYWQHNDQRI